MSSMPADSDGRDVVALVAAAGLGARLGEATPKAFVALGGRSLLAHAVAGLRDSGVIGRIVVIAAADRVQAARQELPADIEVVEGGRERSDSVRAGLDAVRGERFVLVHDAARSLTPPLLIAKVVAALRAGFPAVVPVLPVVDTVKAIDREGVVVATPDRASLRAVQTPQGFTADLLRAAYARADSSTTSPALATDDAALVERLGVAVHTIEGDRLAFKITTPLDLTLARAVVAERAAASAGAL